MLKWEINIKSANEIWGAPQTMCQNWTISGCLKLKGVNCQFKWCDFYDSYDSHMKMISRGTKIKKIIDVRETRKKL